MRRFISIMLMLFLTGAAGASPLDGVRKAFVEKTIENYAYSESEQQNYLLYSEMGRANDLILLQLYMYGHLPSDEVNRLVENFNFDSGAWNDIDYTTKDRGSWHSTLHVTRMLALTKLYCHQSSQWYRNERLKDLIHKSISYWGKLMPKCPNWWHNDIGVPKKMIAAMLCIREELTPEEVAVGLKVLERSAFGKTGQNKVWLAGNQLMKGLLIDDEALVVKAKNIIAEEIVMTDKEGIQEDYSYHQHGAQMQFGNYGLTFIDVMSFWCSVLYGSDYAFSDEQNNLVMRFISDGMNWTVYNGIMDHNACGRQPFRNGPAGKAASVAIALRQFGDMMSDQGDLLGGRYFHRSDYGVFRQKNWFASVRMHSRRTIGYEYTNRENQHAHFSADAALIFMQKGDEYENIQAIWDWRKLPGVTAYEDGNQIPLSAVTDIREGRLYVSNDTEAVSGYASDDCLITAFELRRDGMSGKKAVVCFDDCIVALGTGLGCSLEGVSHLTTALDQTHYFGGEKTGRNWVYHNDRGYVLLDGASFNLTTDFQQGNWYDIDNTLPAKLSSGRVFKLWVEHDVASKNNSYAYVILPYASAKGVAKWAKRPQVEIVENTSECQTIKYGKRMCRIVWHDENTKPTIEIIQ